MSRLARIESRRRFEMLDWTQGSTWFVTGFGTTLTLVMLLCIAVFFANRWQHR